MQLHYSKSEANFDKPLYKCHSCGQFFWADDPRVRRQLPSGPRCECGQPSLPIRHAQTREPLWVCPKTGGGEPCGFELSCGCSPAAAAPATLPAGSSSAGGSSAGGPSAGGSSDRQFLVDAETRNRLQALFHVSRADSAEFGTGADCRGAPPKGYYDYLEVERAWRIAPPPETVAAYEAFRASHSGRGEPTELRAEYAEGVRRLLSHEHAALDESANELLLLHGTKPTVVARILEHSLDPRMARAGLFGRGTYFAEHACKIDQYVKTDREWKGGPRTQKYGETCALHNKLYPNPEMHPGNAHYALVCRVVLGTPFETRKRGPQQPGSHSTLAQHGEGPGDAIKRFREFVLFDKRAIRIEYLVCFKRTKRYCGCGDEVRERSCGERTLIACSRSEKVDGRWAGGCGLCSKLPRCHCRDNHGDFYSASMDASKGLYYRCSRSRCGFQQLIQQGVDLREVEEEECDDEFEDDGWMAFSGEEESGSGSGSESGSGSGSESGSGSGSESGSESGSGSGSESGSESGSGSGSESS